MTRASHVEDGRFHTLPGWELVSVGLADLRAGRSTIESELVRSASWRFTDLGLLRHSMEPAPPGRLYDLVLADVGARRAHGRYNALRRRLASFLRAAAIVDTR